MANLTNTQLLAAIQKASNDLIDRGEFRDFEHTSTKALLDGENSVFRNLNALKQSDLQPTTVDLNKRVYTASGAAKSAAHAAAAFPDSFTKSITYLRLTQTFKVSYKQADMNRLSYADILQHELKNKLISLYTDLSTNNLAWLNTNRSQVASNGLMAFDGVNFNYDNVLAEKDYFFEHIKSTQVLNKYNGMNSVMVGDQRASALYRKLAANGTMNADNTAYQIPGISVVEEPQLALTANEGVGFVWEKGLVGMTTWNEPLNRRGSGDVGNNEGLFTTMVDPAFGVNLDLHVVRGIANTSGAGGNVQDMVDEYEIALTYALEGSWTDVANESHIFKISQAYV